MEKMEGISRFNLRVYAIIINEGKVLLADEQIRNLNFTKFPGGGVEFGEGILDALQREIREELGAEVLSTEHCYTTDFFQQSAFNPADQVVSVYYKVGLKDFLITQNEWIQFSETQRGRFYFHAINDELNEILTFPIDKYVAKRILPLHM